MALLLSPKVGSVLVIYGRSCPYQHCQFQFPYRRQRRLQCATAAAAACCRRVLLWPAACISPSASICWWSGACLRWVCLWLAEQRGAAGSRRLRLRCARQCSGGRWRRGGRRPQVRLRGSDAAEAVQQRGESRQAVLCMPQGAGGVCPTGLSLHLSTSPLTSRSTHFNYNLFCFVEGYDTLPLLQLVSSWFCGLQCLSASIVHPRTGTKLSRCHAYAQG